jgi:enamine deaminase RidA (YjgF/YER057c/UK114 family)
MFKKKTSSKEKQNETARIRYVIREVDRICKQAGLAMHCVIDRDQFSSKAVIKFTSQRKGTLEQCQVAYMDEVVKEQQKRQEALEKAKENEEAKLEELPKA